MDNIYLTISEDDALIIRYALQRYIDNPTHPTGDSQNVKQAQRIREGLGEAMRSDSPRRWASSNTAPFVWSERGAA